MSYLWRRILPRSRPPFHSWIMTAAQTPVGPHPPLTSSPPFHLSLRLLHVGQSASLVRSFTSRDLELFSELTGDTNPIHVDPAHLSTSSSSSSSSSSSPFTSPVVHGVLVNGLVSAVLGTRLPGPGSVLLRQDIRFPAPLYLGEEVQALATVRKVKMNLAFITVRCSVQRDEKVVMEGEVVVRIP